MKTAVGELWNQSGDHACARTDGRHSIVMFLAKNRITQQSSIILRCNSCYLDDCGMNVSIANGRVCVGIIALGSNAAHVQHETTALRLMLDVAEPPDASGRD